ncbi:MAG TPA: YciI family protein [Verrucomicrobiae bacterium]|nr:YciI family protein [Verrucomicrobiae bacterium]
MSAHFLVKLIPPRTSFALDMSDEERRLMQRHVEYWSDLAEKGVALIFGPVLDPAGSYGIGVVEVEKAEDLKDLTANDPVSKCGSKFRHETYVMPRLVVGRR